MVNPCPHHDTINTETIMFQNTIDGITFIMTSTDSGTSICSEQHEARFIEKDNCSPRFTSPWNMFLTLLKSFSEMMCRENVESHRSPCLIRMSRWPNGYRKRLGIASDSVP